MDDSSVRIELSGSAGAGLWAVIDEADLPLVSPYRWYAHKTRWATYAKAVFWADGRTKSIYMHRLILDAPKGLKVDHHDHDGLHNRRSNLRLASTSQNNANFRVEGRSRGSRYKGVYWYAPTRRWTAHIGIGGRSYNLGYFPTAEDGARAYDAAAVRLFGEFACPNFPPDVSEDLAS